MCSNLNMSAYEKWECLCNGPRKLFQQQVNAWLCGKKVKNPFLIVHPFASQQKIQAIGVWKWNCSTSKNVISVNHSNSIHNVYTLPHFLQIVWNNRDSIWFKIFGRVLRKHSTESPEFVIRIIIARKQIGIVVCVSFIWNGELKVALHLTKSKITPHIHIQERKVQKRQRHYKSKEKQFHWMPNAGQLILAKSIPI